MSLLIILFIAFLSLAIYNRKYKLNHPKEPIIAPIVIIVILMLLGIGFSDYFEIKMHSYYDHKFDKIKIEDIHSCSNPVKIKYLKIKIENESKKKMIQYKKEHPFKMCYSIISIKSSKLLQLTILLVSCILVILLGITLQIPTKDRKKLSDIYSKKRRLIGGYLILFDILLVCSMIFWIFYTNYYDNVIDRFKLDVLNSWLDNGIITKCQYLIMK